MTRMAKGPKTRKTKASVTVFLDAIPDAARRADCKAVAAMMRKVSRAAPKMWGPGIVGFGSWRLKYASGKELDWPALAFASRKTDLTIYLDPDQDQADLLARLGKHKMGKCCLYIKRLADVDRSVLEALIRKNYQARPGAERR